MKLGMGRRNTFAPEDSIMFRRDEKEYKVYSPPEFFGDEGKFIGTVRCAVGYRSDEEVSEDDVSRLNVSAAVIVPCRRSPAEGFARGCRLCGDGREFTVRRAVKGRH